MHMNRIRLAGSTALSRPALIRARTRDAMMTFDRATIDSTGVFLISELERLDQTLHQPLVSITWSRDIDLREDVSIADEASSFTNSSFASAGGATPSGKAWIGKDSTSITGLALDIGKTSNPLYLWGMEVSYSLPELESAQKLGRPVDAQKFQGMQTKHQMDIDEQVYIGDSSLGKYGLVNSDLVTVDTLGNGAAGTATWVTKSPDEILADVNTTIQACWAAAGYAVCPGELRLPPSQFAYVASQKVSDAGNVSILQFLEENSISLRVNGRKLNIQPLKWLATAARSGATADRMVVYTKANDRVRFPLVPLQRTPLEYRSIFHTTTYFGRLGVVEFVYPETVRYADGL